MEAEFNIEKCLFTLKNKRKIFHSEADFQFALGWVIKELYNDAEIRFEYPVSLSDKRKSEYVDILVLYKQITIYIELKYKTAFLNTENLKEEFNLKNHGAQDIGKYDFLKDIARLEKLTNSQRDIGYAIWLTNDLSYIKRPKSDTVIYKEFSVHDNSIKQGNHKWQGNPSSGTTKNREDPIYLHNTYKILWKEYSNFGETKNTKFFYAISTVTKK